MPMKAIGFILNKGIYMKTTISAFAIFMALLFTACGGGESEDSTQSNNQTSKSIPAFPTLPGVDTPPSSD